jgi:hypothetical protein
MSRNLMIGVAAACLLFTGVTAYGDLFQAPVKLAFPPNNATPVFSIATDAEPCVTADRLTLYWHQFSYPDYQGIVSTTRASTANAWGGPVTGEANINDDLSDEKEPSISQDGLEMYYNKNNVLYVSTRASTAVPFPAGVPLTFDGTYDEASYTEGTPEISADGQHLYFSSNKLTANGMGGKNLFVATRGASASQWGSVDDLDNGVSYWPGYGNAFGGDELSPTVSDDELAILFAANRLSGSYYGIFMATRDNTSQDFGNRTLLTEVSLDGVNNNGPELGFGYSKDDVLAGLASLYLNRDDAGANLEDLYFAAAIPEPASMLLLGMGGLALLRRRRA